MAVDGQKGELGNIRYPQSQKYFIHGSRHSFTAGGVGWGWLNLGEGSRAPQMPPVDPELGSSSLLLLDWFIGQ